MFLDFEFRTSLGTSILLYFIAKRILWTMRSKTQQRAPLQLLTRIYNSSRFVEILHFTGRFHFLYHRLLVSVKEYSMFGHLWRFYFSQLITIVTLPTPTGKNCNWATFYQAITLIGQEYFFSLMMMFQRTSRTKQSWGHLYTKTIHTSVTKMTIVKLCDHWLQHTFNI